MNGQNGHCQNGQNGRYGLFDFKMAISVLHAVETHCNVNHINICIQVYFCGEILINAHKLKKWSKWSILSLINYN